MTANLLGEAGYATLLLGADVPADAIAGSAQRHETEVICLSSTMPGGIDVVLDVIDTVRRQAPATAFVIGGRGITTRVRARPRLDVCVRVAEVVEAVDALVKRADLN